jgi:hypothetical protein
VLPGIISHSFWWFFIAQARLHNDFRWQKNIFGVNAERFSEEMTNECFTRAQ